MKRLLAALVVLSACKSSHHAATGVAPARIGDAVKFDDSEWVVLDVNDAGKVLESTSAINHETRKTEGRFVIVHYKVTNSTKDEQMLITPPKIVDKKGDGVEHIAMESFFLPPSEKTVALDTLEPNQPREYWTVFDVPAGATGLQCEFHALAAFGQKREVDLKL